LVPATVAAEPAPAPAAPIGADALWVWWWETPAALVRNVEANGFSRVYLYAEGGFDTKVRKAIAALGAEGIGVEALGGESRWATTQRADLLDFVRSAVAYQRSAPANAELAGIHLDVEPYGLASWDRDLDATAGSLVRSLSAATQAAGALPVAADIPFWFDGIHASKGAPSLAERIIRGTDATTIMAYRDSGPDVIGVAKQEVAIAARFGKLTTIGLETGEVTPEQVTFWEEGRAALDEAVAEIRARFADVPGFGGVAIHHYESLQSLRP
jgi:hypothetical protein